MILLNYYLNQILTVLCAYTFRELLSFSQTKTMAVGGHASQSNAHESAGCGESIACLHNSDTRKIKEKTGNNINSKKTLCARQLQQLLSLVMDSVFATATEFLGQAGWAITTFSLTFSNNLKVYTKQYPKAHIGPLEKKKQILTIMYELLLRF